MEECGIPGTEEVGARDSEVKDEVRVEECLWDCQWQPNPCYKKVLKWITKLTEKKNTEDNTHLLLFTSPQLPRNLRCLEDCFVRFKAGSDWAKRSKVRRKCSANGLDRMIPTHRLSQLDVRFVFFFTVKYCLKMGSFFVCDCFPYFFLANVQG